MPVILEKDGSPWVHGNLYLAERALLEKLDSKTFLSIASDLKKVREILDQEQVSYLADNKYKSQRPTYVVKRVLKRAIDEEGFSIESGNRILGRLVGFYDFLKNRANVHFEFPLYMRTERMIPFTDHVGFLTHKKTYSTDLTFKKIKDPHAYDGYVNDGGKLRPLMLEEVRAIIRALACLHNTEMTLAMLIALTTGARIQTVFTLRIGSISRDVVPDDESVAVAVGGNSMVDTKYNKKMVVFVPGWLANKINIYLGSERAINRRQLAKNFLDDEAKQYIFLTRTGAPYYMSRKDKDNVLYSEPPRGGSVRKFMAQQLFPEMEQAGNSVRFRFHDLRATFAMSVLRSCLVLVEQGKMSKDEMLQHVATRLGQSNVITALSYLNFAIGNTVHAHVQMEWEKEIAGLVDLGYELFSTNEDLIND